MTHPVLLWRRGSGLRRFTQAQRQQIRLEYERGLTLTAVARMFRTTRPTATRAIVDAGGTIRMKGVRGVPS